MHSLKHMIDGASVFLVIGTILQWLPPVAAGLTIIWTGIRIYETETVQKWIKKRKDNAKT